MWRNNWLAGQVRFIYLASQITIMAIVAPSLLAANFLRLEEECKMLNESEADWFHLDVMDGRFVPNISYGPMIIEFIRKTTQKPCDVHLMILEPEKFAEEFKEAGANHVTVHIEACPNLHRNIQQIKSLGMQAGVAINPHTPVTSLIDVLQDIDIVCLMSVNPGFGGQKFIPQSIDKVRRLRRMIEERQLNVRIEIDGGIDRKNIETVVSAGAEIIVAGSAVFNTPDAEAAVRELRDATVQWV